MHTIEVEAKSVKEAIALACEQLQTTEDNLSVEVLQDGSGLFSLFSGKKAKIRARKVTAPAPDTTEAVAELRRILERIVRCIDPEASVETLTHHEETVLHIVSADSALFIGKKGQTLEAFQYLINKIKMHHCKDAPHLIVDAGSYRQRHIESLAALAKRLSEKAKQRNCAVSTAPLAPSDRRIIHLTLKDDSTLTTRSKGDGFFRKVIIAPRYAGASRQHREPSAIEKRTEMQ